MASNYDYGQELREYYEQCEDNLARLKNTIKTFETKLWCVMLLIPRTLPNSAQPCSIRK